MEAMGNDVVAQKELRFSARALADEVKITVDFVVPPDGHRTVDAGILTATIRSSLKGLMTESQFSSFYKLAKGVGYDWATLSV